MKPFSFPSALPRQALGALFLVLGLGKALDPVAFLQALRQYELPGPGVPFAALLPWFEAYCGLLLLAGVAVRGAAAVLLGLLLVFTLAILQRALALHAAGGIPFCALRFDCGCGTGERLVCLKLAENLGLLLLSAWVVGKPTPSRLRPPPAAPANRETA